MRQKILLLLMAITCGSFSAMAYHTQDDVTDDDIHWFHCDFFADKWAFNYLSQEDRTVEVTSMWPAEMDADRWIYEAETLVIPEKVIYEGIEYSVTAIGSGTFTYSKIKHLVIPSTVREIKQWAFRSVYELEELIIPNTVEIIGNEVFAGNMMYIGSSYPKVVVFPETVESIGTSLFAWSGEPENDRQMATFPGNMTEVPERTYYRSWLKEWKDLPESVEVIGKSAFYGNLFTSIHLPSGLKEIKTGAFSLCNELKSVTIPASVTFIGRQAFSGARDYWSDPEQKCSLDTLRMLSKVPCTSELLLAKTVLVVPKGCKEVYREAWDILPYVVIIEEDNSQTGIKTINHSKNTIDIVYNLQGQRLTSAPKKGIYIQNGKKIRAD